MNILSKSLLAGAAALALSGTIAAAEVVCNEDGDCWRVEQRREYGPELRLKIHPKDWKWGDNEKDKYRWRDAPSGKHGYYRQGVWIDIK